MNKTAILTVSFGTSFHETREANIGAIEREIAAAFPDAQVCRAFTSGMIIKKLRERDGILVDTVEQALDRLVDGGYDTVLCQPTHIIAGEEYDDIVTAANPYRSRFKDMRIGAPLLNETEDYKRVAAALGERFSPPAGTALCLMGHGSSHPADCSYAALDYHFKDQGWHNIFVGTVEGFPELDTVLRHVSESGAQKVILAPFMVVAGDHAAKDMASDEPDSWKTAFTKAGLEVECILSGLGEYPEIREIYLDHIRAALSGTES